MSKKKEAVFVRVALKDGSSKLKLIFPNRSESGEFVDCLPEVKVKATSKFSEGDLVVIEIKEDTGDFTVTSISSATEEKSPEPETKTGDLGDGKATPPPETTTAEKKVPVSENLKNPKDVPPLKSNGGYYQKELNPKVSERVLRTSVFQAACHAVNALPGTVDINNLGEVIEGIYNKGLELITKEA